MLIISAEELMNYFQRLARKGGCVSKPIYVASDIRKQILTSQEQGKITLEGKVCKLDFYNQGGGVWSVKCVDLQGMEL